jgi:lipoprotein-anchoring transpeptidase ErfK/SrfK
MTRQILSALVAIGALLPPAAAVAAPPGTQGPPGPAGITVTHDAFGDPWQVTLKQGLTLPLYTPGTSATPARLQTPGTQAIRSRQVDPAFLPTTVAYATGEQPGTIVIDTNARYLYLVLDDGRAMRYGVGVGRPGFEWAGVHAVTRKSEWPDWTPPPEMLARQPGLPRHMAGGPDNPLGARALYLGSTLYRIHGSNEPWTIGHAVSSGCIRMRNEDVIELYSRVGVGTKVIVI